MLVLLIVTSSFLCSDNLNTLICNDMYIYPQGQSALFSAVESGRLECVEYLLKINLSPTLTNVEGRRSVIVTVCVCGCAWVPVIVRVCVGVHGYMYVYVCVLLSCGHIFIIS